MVMEETWGISLARACAFFESQTDVMNQGSCFSFQSCQITLIALEPGKLGTIPIPRTLLRMEGPEPEVRAIHRRFFLQFLSAGG